LKRATVAVTLVPLTMNGAWHEIAKGVGKNR